MRTPPNWIFIWPRREFQSSLFRLFRELSAKADIVNYHFPWPMMDVVHLVEMPRCPTVVTYHSDVVRQRLLNFFYRPLMHKFLKDVDHIVATSSNYVRSSEVLRSYPDKTSVIPIGIGQAEPPSTAVLEKWRKETGEGFFLFVGVLRYYKGLDFLLEAARRTGLPLVVAGSGSVEPRWIGLGNVRFLGEVSDDDKEALLRLCRAFVFPSHLRSEAFGIALLEAARAGKPMISCEIGTGTSYINLHQETGLVVPPADAAALADAMRALSSDAEIANTMGRNARARYEELFTADAMSEAYFRLYTQLRTANG